MQKQDSPYVLHVFVCTNKKPNNKECCADKNAESLRLELKEWLRTKPEWKGRVRVNAAGCLDQCSQGIAVACYPEGEMWLKVQATDAEELKQQITEKMEQRNS